MSVIKKTCYCDFHFLFLFLIIVPSYCHLARELLIPSLTYFLQLILSNRHQWWLGQGYRTKLKSCKFDSLIINKWIEYKFIFIFFRNNKKQMTSINKISNDTNILCSIIIESKFITDIKIKKNIYKEWVR